jgi:hypothetical protein
MKTDIVPYSSNTHLNNSSSGLHDLNGTFDDIGELIAYVRDLTQALVPLARNVDATITDLPKKISNFLEDNVPLAITGIAGGVLIGGYLASGIVKNIVSINRDVKKKTLNDSGIGGNLADRYWDGSEYIDEHNHNFKIKDFDHARWLLDLFEKKYKMYKDEIDKNPKQRAAIMSNLKKLKKRVHAECVKQESRLPAAANNWRADHLEVYISKLREKINAYEKSGTGDPCWIESRKILAKKLDKIYQKKKNK